MKRTCSWTELQVLAFTLSLFLPLFAGTNVCTADSIPASQSNKVNFGGGSGNGGSGTVTPDLFTGTFSYSIPIEVPAGRKGMDPGLALIYRSNNGNSWVGMGWELEVGAIERSMKSGVNYTGDDYILRIAGGALDLVNVGTNEYSAKIEGFFYRIVKIPNADGSPNYWVVYDKSGVKYTYGHTAYNGGAIPRQDNPSVSTKVFKWCLDRVEDTNGNYMTLSYSKTPFNTPYANHGQIYLDRIDYTGNDSTSPSQPTTNYVKFYLETRNDASDMYSLKFKVKTAYRLKTIDIISNSNRVRAYKLVYDADPNSPGYQYSASTSRSLLYSVQQFGKDAILDASWTVTGGSALPESKFIYQQNATGWSRTANDIGDFGTVHASSL